MKEYDFGYKNFDLEFAPEDDEKKVILTFDVVTDCPNDEIDPQTVAFLTADGLCTLMESLGVDPEYFFRTVLEQRAKGEKHDWN